MTRLEWLDRAIDDEASLVSEGLQEDADDILGTIEDELEGAPKMGDMLPEVVWDRTTDMQLVLQYLSSGRRYMFYVRRTLAGFIRVTGTKSADSRVVAVLERRLTEWLGEEIEEA